jgi:hypothetical protein
MALRTVKVQGWGCVGSEKRAKITALLDGETVFSGDVDLVEMDDTNDRMETAPTLFTFEIPMDYAGTKHLVYKNENAAVRYGQMVINYNITEVGDIQYSDGPDMFDDVACEDADGIIDPRTNVTVNGEPQKAMREFGNGTWHWTVQPDSSLEHDTVFRAGLSDLD